MEQRKIYHDVELEIDGMGLVLYSPGAVKNLVEGENFFEKDYSMPQQVSAHIKKGDIVGFCTGSGGRFHIKFREGYPSEEISKKYPISIRLGLDVSGGKIAIIDLFWLMEWSQECPEEQQIEVEDGIYHLTILTAQPDSGIWGDDQEISIYLNKMDKMPELTWEGVPELFF